MGPNGEIAVGDFYDAALLPNTDAFSAPDPDLAGQIRLIIDGEVITISPPCQFANDDGTYSPVGMNEGCMGPVAAFAFDTNGGIYALAQSSADGGLSGDTADGAPGIYYFAPPTYAETVIVSPTSKAPDACVVTLPPNSEQCNQACMRRPPLLDSSGDELGFFQGGIAVGADGNVYFTDQEVLRKVTRTGPAPEQCQISVVAGTPNQISGQAVATVPIPPGIGPLSQPFNNLVGLALSPRTLDLYAIDSVPQTFDGPDTTGENVVVRIRY